MIFASLDALAAAEQHQPAEDQDRDHLEQPKTHERRSCRRVLVWPNRSHILQVKF
jgi:hypothetical protein